MRQVLAQSDKYVITHEYEVASLLNRNSGREVIIGDFYGGPEVAFISKNESYCVVGGCGLIIYYLKEPFQEYEYHVDSKQWKEFFRDPNDFWWISNISEGSKLNKVRFYIGENDSRHAVNHELDVFTLEYTRLSRR